MIFHQKGGRLWFALRYTGSGGSAAPEAVAAEGPASGGPEAGSASGGPVPSLELFKLVPNTLENGLLAYALEYLHSDVIYYEDVSDADCEQHYKKYGQDPLVVPQVAVQKGSHAWTAHMRGWVPQPGDPVKIADLFVGGLNDPPP